MSAKRKIGDSVAVKKGIKDPDYGHDISGHQGRIIEIETESDDPLVCIEWDSKTLERIPRSLIRKSEDDGLDWTRLHLNASEVESAKPRDNRRKVAKIAHRIARKVGLNEEPKRQITHEELLQNPFLVTLTGEPYQPARVHYEIADRRAVAKAFSKLRCMDYDPDKKRWVWLYEAEAKELEFLQSYSDIPEDKKSLVLGAFFSRAEDSMHLDVNSFARATKAIAFFDKHLKSWLLRRKLARVTDIEIVNKFFAPPLEKAPGHIELFDMQQSWKPEDILSRIEEITSPVIDPKEKRQIALSLIEESAKKPLPEIERLPTHFYEDGIEALETTLNMRTAIAHKHWQGHKDYSIHDLVHEVMSR